MAFNPIAFTENVVKSFLRYQFTTYAFADERLTAQMRELLSLDAFRTNRSACRERNRRDMNLPIA